MGGGKGGAPPPTGRDASRRGGSPPRGQQQRGSSPTATDFGSDPAMVQIKNDDLDPVTGEDLTGDWVFTIQFEVVLADLPQAETGEAQDAATEPESEKNNG